MGDVKKSRISVIMAAKNAEATIGSAIKSCLHALRPSDELLVFLDGCSDGTELEVSKITDSRIRVFASEMTIGRSAARNFLLKLATGDYIAIQDADDISFFWRFWISRRLLTQYDAVFGNAVIFGPGINPIPFAPLYPVQIKPELAPWILTYRNPFVHSGAIFSRSFVDQGYSYEEVIAEEYLMWLQMAISGARMMRTRMPLVAYRIHDGQVTSAPEFESKVEESEQLTKAKGELLKLMFESTSLPKSVASADDFPRGHVYAQSKMMWFEENFVRNLRAFLNDLRKALTRA